jgi:hypothetical protein
MPPPLDASEGFQDLKSLKAAIAKPSSSPVSAPPASSVEKKGVTQESRSSLRAALASIMPSSTQPAAKPQPPKSPPIVNEALTAQANMRPADIPLKSSSNTVDKAEKSGEEGPKEVPEHVLKRILEV